MNACRRQPHKNNNKVSCAMISTLSFAPTVRFFQAQLSCLVLISLMIPFSADSAEIYVADTATPTDTSEDLPDSGSHNGFAYQIIHGQAVFEGDMLLGKVDKYGGLAGKLQGRGIGVNDIFSRWPDGIVVYEFPYENSLTQQINVSRAIQHWTDNTTLSFVERTEENAEQYDNYIQFEESNGCASHVGMIGGAQPVYISDACTTGSVIHEIGHAVGLFHEHTRSDRNSFVTIDWDEIQNGRDINFAMQTANVALYSDYDYGSIMHYGKHFFSKTGKPTIIVADSIEIGQREALSPMDIESANNMYETDLALGTPVQNSVEGGIEIDVTVNNMGSLGAHQLELVIQLTDESAWTGVSADSGWTCLTFGSELKCTKDTLHELSESSFTIGASSTDASNANLSMRLVSRTQDSNPENNAFNDDNVEWQSLSKESSSADTKVLEKNPEPKTLAANTESSPNNDDESSASEITSSGAMTLFILMLLSAILLTRRRQLALRCLPVPSLYIIDSSKQGRA